MIRRAPALHLELRLRQRARHAQIQRAALQHRRRCLVGAAVRQQVGSRPGSCRRPPTAPSYATPWPTPAPTERPAATAHIPAGGPGGSTPAGFPALRTRARYRETRFVPHSDVDRTCLEPPPTCHASRCCGRRSCIYCKSSSSSTGRCSAPERTAASTTASTCRPASPVTSGARPVATAAAKSRSSSPR